MPFVDFQIFLQMPLISRFINEIWSSEEYSGNRILCLKFLNSNGRYINKSLFFLPFYQTSPILFLL